ncbi:MAG: TlpA family protein disulfide reductase [Saprospiraceae bacterium]|nr:TlpA family protein disulfide reductase [Saprospiraceae bacterium]
MPPDSIIGALNANIASVRQGYFSNLYRRKSAMKTDTLNTERKIYFFRDRFDQDSICPFILQHKGETMYAYDGATYYFINRVKNTINTKQASEHGGMRRILGRNSYNSTIYQPILYGGGKPAFKPAAWKKAALDTLHKPWDETLILTVVDTFDNTDKLTPKDPDKILYTRILEISLPGYTLKRNTLISVFTQMPQYQDHILSPIVPLPDSVTFERVLGLDQLLRAGFVMVAEGPPEQEKPNAAHVNLSVGDTFPAFRVLNQAGQPLHSDALNEGIILLDFWYRSCAPCIKAMPSIEALYRQYAAKGLHILGVNSHDANDESLEKFLRYVDISYPVVFDPEKKIVTQVGVYDYPTIVLLEARSKKVLLVESGFGEEMDAAIRKILDAQR